MLLFSETLPSICRVNVTLLMDGLIACRLKHFIIRVSILQFRQLSLLLWCGRERRGQICSVRMHDKYIAIAIGLSNTK